MAKTTTATYEKLGFDSDMFPSWDDFDKSLINLITKKAKLLENRISSAKYALTTEPVKSFVLSAEEALVAAELIRIRINTMMNNAVPNGEIDPTKALFKQRNDYLADYEQLVVKINSNIGNSSGYSGKAVVHD